MTLRSALARAAKELAQISDTPRLDAELLAAYAFNVDRNTMILGGLDWPEPPIFCELVERRLAHEPIAYITGERDFWTLTLKVARGVLIPRPDSETLIEAAIEHFGSSGPRSILDLGTGSGALLLAALSYWPNASGIGVDASDVALEIAQANADRLNLAGRAKFRLGDWARGIGTRFDLILCNPPYVETQADLAPEVRDYEPASALFAGADGLDDLRQLAPQLNDVLALGGVAVVEIGHKQGQAAAALFAERGYTVAIRQDIGRRDRCLVLTRKR